MIEELRKQEEQLTKLERKAREAESRARAVESAISVGVSMICLQLEFHQRMVLGLLMRKEEN